MLVACAIAACGGASSNGVASKSPNAIVTAALNAVDGAKSAHISGKLESGALPATLNLYVVTGKGGRGQVSQGGRSFKIVVANNEVYVNGSVGFWRHYVRPGLAALLQGKWLKAPVNGKYAVLAQLTNLHALLATLVSPDGQFAKSRTATVDGQSAVGIRDATQDGILYVATTGKPYLLEIVATGSQGGRIALDDFNRPVTLTPPPGAISVSQFR